ncbi:MAG TPA: ATP-binding cassette domain-containing protein [Candidatus Acidoferrales bacterium]|nr:ATP-binding cassette domain-containing protein [Candidatus Acidoferrales bacterium]
MSKVQTRLVNDQISETKQILETKSLTRQFGPLIAVDNFSTGIRNGEIFGLVGPNGAGKTTVIKMLTTLLQPTAGNAWVGGYDIVHNPAQVRRIIGYVPQLLSADGSLTAFENLLIFAKLYHIPRAERGKRIREALAFMGLADVANKMVREYSGGMIRRLEIAESMLHRPKVLFLDEPTVGLDPVARKMVWDHIQQLRSDFGTTILLTTHYMEEADTLCNRVAIMHFGKVAAIGTPSELKASVGEGATLDDVFVHYSGYEVDSGGNYRDISRTRRTARRLG